MSRSRLFGAVAMTACVMVAAPAWSQQSACVNDAPDHHTSLGAWGALPAGRPWGSTAGIDVAPDGHVWVVDRCGAVLCADSPLAPIMEFTPDGKLVQAFGAGLFVFPHGLTVAPNGDIWVTDGQARDGKGDQVLKFSPTGKLLMRLGVAGQWDIEGGLDQPTSVAIAKNGDIYVAEGHNPNYKHSQVVRYSADGKRLGIIAPKGTELGQVLGPHALAFDSQGRLFVADRTNNRISIFDAQGRFLTAWKQFSRPSGIRIDKDDRIYVADSESNDGTGYGSNPGCHTGIRVGSARTGMVDELIPVEPSTEQGNPAAEGVAFDRTGAVYGAVNGTHGVRKWALAR